ncbi:MAG: superoxide dismutase [Bacteroidia bacterium]
MSKNKMERREFIRTSALLGAGGLVLSALPGSLTAATPAIPADIYTLPPLPYAYDALEPFIDKLTMEIHHGKHHAAYVTNLNKAIESGKSAPADISELCRTIHEGNAALRNNGGGHFNHSFFWKLMKPPVSKDAPAPEPSGKLMEDIKASFGSFDAFKTKFGEKAKSVFGSGWCWLIVNDVYKLEISTTPNQDNPLMQFALSKGIPVLALDVWEHAYYLKHQNLRMDYVNDWWKVVNWEEAEKLYTAGKK